jgi:subtilisin family serine protease
MMELLHAAAPNASLVFATGIPSLAVFASAIDALVADGCHIIVDDLQYFTESVFQDGQTTPSIVNQGIVMDAVKRAANSGVLVFSSAGNAGQKDANTSTTYEATFVDSSVPLSGGALHAFAPGPVVGSRIMKNFSSMTLQWDSPIGSSSADYDFYILDSTGATVIFSSNFVQNSTMDPIEFFACQPLGTYCIVAGMQVAIVRKTGSVNATKFHLACGRPAPFQSRL